MYLSLRTAVEGRLQRLAKDAVENKTTSIQRSLCETRTLHHFNTFELTQRSGLFLILESCNYRTSRPDAREVLK